MTNSTALLTDFYEVTMLQAALQAGKANMKSTFELFGRKLPEGRRYGVVAGTNRALKAIQNFRFTQEQLDYIAAQTNITSETVEYLKNFKFNGVVRGYRDGDLYFPNSPILSVEGTFGECVLLETVLLSIFNYDSAVASAASRMVMHADGKPIIEMGSRRTNELAAVAASRAAYIAGFQATSNIEAGMKYEIPVSGTSAHAFTLAFADEKDAFKAQIEALGVKTTLLVDTYDIEQGIRNAVEVAGQQLGGIRIDSGELVEEVKKARVLLDELGAKQTKIVVSSDIDEYMIKKMVDEKAPVDVYGAGTRVVTGSGAPTAGFVYKLVEREDAEGNMIPVEKRATGKKSIGGRKVAFRTFDWFGYIKSEQFVTRGNEDLIPTEMKFTQETLISHGVYDFEDNIEIARARHAEKVRTVKRVLRELDGESFIMVEELTRPVEVTETEDFDKLETEAITSNLAVDEITESKEVA